MATADLFSLRGRRALIPGSGQGIGLMLARGLGAAGAELVRNDLDSARLEQAIGTRRDEGFRVMGRCCNVAKAAEVAPARAAVERAARECNRGATGSSPSGTK